MEFHCSCPPDNEFVFSTGQTGIRGDSLAEGSYCWGNYRLYIQLMGAGLCWGVPSLGGVLCTLRIILGLKALSQKIVVSAWRSHRQLWCANTGCQGLNIPATSGIKARVIFMGILNPLHGSACRNNCLPACGGCTCLLFLGTGTSWQHMEFMSLLVLGG